MSLNAEIAAIPNRGPLARYPDRRAFAERACNDGRAFNDQRGFPDQRGYADDQRSLSGLCSEVFWSLARADQRRWAEVYVRGLLSVPGRKSIRRICDQVVGYPAEQSLQQFLSQSPWDEREVRRNLATMVAASTRPRAIAFREVAFPKHGNSSVAVARQYAPSLGRMLNGQLGIVAFLATDAGAFPVNWRLAMRAGGRGRQAARGHRGARGRAAPALVLLCAGGAGRADRPLGLPPAPVLVDARHERRLEPLLRGLEARRVHYAVQVSGDCPVRPVRGGAVAAVPVGAAAGQPARPMTVADLAGTVPPGNRTVVGWSGPGRGGCSAFALTPLVSLPPGQQVRVIAAVPPAGTRGT